MALGCFSELCVKDDSNLTDWLYYKLKATSHWKDASCEAL